MRRCRRWSAPFAALFGICDGGGFLLGSAFHWEVPDNVGTVVTQVEGRNGVLECIPDPTICVLEPGCLLRHLLMDSLEHAPEGRNGKWSYERRGN